ncbi:hypothetical protein [Pseudomaricurvus sp. HS19]|uniref:hypothetical protein n=1 Tax=Pseudomaricurvus sp. HS19 TaxID=2692626 RepID=UPI00136DDC04|nr:hypothetical protein [Pseudomaricurvus sp. HS19]MYM62480.1 hypothetical protein [Pseudomaricurvus sp. HS19]
MSLKPTYQERLQERLAAEQGAIAALRTGLQAALSKLGFDDKAGAIDEPLVNPELRRDSYEGTDSLFAEWRTPSGALLGYLLIHGAGQIYAEYDVLAAHPTKSQWFIEAVTAWGSAEAVKTEPRLLPALQD